MHDREHAVTDIEKVDNRSAFSGDVIEFLKTGSQERSFEQDMTILSRGDKGRALFVIISGIVEVRLHHDSQRQLTLARLGAGDFFGEMSLLRDEPISADVVAVGPVRILTCPQDFFHSALAESSFFRQELFACLAQRIQHTSAEMWSIFQRSEAMKLLYHQNSGSVDFIANSRKMRKVLREMESLAGQNSTVLIVGEAGTGKRAVAQKIHSLVHESVDPLIAVDCNNHDHHDLLQLIFGMSGSDDISHLAQRFGAIHLAHRGTLVIHHIEALSNQVREVLHHYMQQCPGKSDYVYPHVRIILTMTAKSQTVDHSLSPWVDRLINDCQITILDLPRLAERKSDIIPLSRSFVDPSDEKTVHLTVEAEHALLQHHYRTRNVAELKEIIELATMISEDGTLRGEYFFTFSREEDVPLEVRLSGRSIIEALLQKVVLEHARSLVLVTFLIIIVLCLLVPDTLIGRIANSFIWGLWEPALILSFLLFGHLWCTVCPLSSMAMQVQKVGSLGYRPLTALKKGSLWFGMVGFFLIIWSERVFHMVDHPRASGMLLLLLVLIAVLLAVLFKREVWCRYLCPLGMLASAFSPSSMLHVRAKASVCANSCTTHDCFKGNEDEQGCPVFHHPLSVAEGLNCKLCFQCLKVCPHASAGLYARPFLQGIWVFGRWSQQFISFNLFIFFFGLVLLGAQNIPFLNNPVVFTISGISTIIVAGLASKLISQLCSGESETSFFSWGPVSFTLLLTAWAPLMTYQAAHIPDLDKIIISVAPHSIWSFFLPVSALSVLHLIQVSIIVGTGVMASFVLFVIMFTSETKGKTVRWTLWIVLFSTILLYLGLCLYIVGSNIS